MFLVKTFFFFDIYKNDVISDLTDTFPGDNVFTFSGEQTAESTGTRDDEGSKTSGLAVEFHICRTSKTAACAGIDNFFLFQITDTHDKTCAFLFIYAEKTCIIPIHLLTRKGKIKYNIARKIMLSEFWPGGDNAVKCPFCNQDNTKVVDSRPVEDTNSIRRRRMCDACGKRFTTYEKVETIPLSVIKKDQNREQYDRAKIQAGILRACYKRPISIEKIETMMDSIEGEIFNTEEREIPSTRIGEVVMEHLKDLDAVAYVRFASVYREFKDVSTFMDELKKFMEP